MTQQHSLVDKSLAKATSTRYGLGACASEKQEDALPIRAPDMVLTVVFASSDTSSAILQTAPRRNNVVG